MNQILFNKNNKPKSQSLEIVYNTNTNTNNNVKKIFQIQLIISSIIILFCLIHICFKIYNNKKNTTISNKLSDSFNITTLYSNNLNTNLYQSAKTSINSDQIIGIIEIPDINVNYPFFYNTTDELLKISPCRFYGPLPNSIGNLCIAGHNYNNNKFFSKLNLLNTNSRIRIYDLSRKFCRLLRI